MYSASGAMKMNALEQQILSDNLANINTTGFKGEKVSFRSFKPNLVRGDDNKIVGSMVAGVNVHSTHNNFSQGSLRLTNNPLDVAITGEGLFAVETPSADIQYTRNGHFSVDKDGFITNAHGDKLLDQGLSPIVLDMRNTSDISIKKDGSILADGESVTRLATFKFPQGAGILRLAGDKFDLSDDGMVMQQAVGDSFHQGFLEESNVNAVKSSTDMIKVMRHYEANQRSLRTQADTLRLLIDVGKI